ncbi:MAG: ABC transporter ATP-binding protein [Coprobacillaceae bacterium]
MKEIIKFEKVSRIYGTKVAPVKAIDEISFTIDEGEFVVVLGPSGAGKSTILNLLGGMDQATSGSIIINNEDITNINDNALTEYRAKNVGFVFQFYNLIPNLTALENVALTKEICNEKVDYEEVMKSIGLTRQMHQFPTQLSGGEQQRVSIARAIAKNPTMLLCDEPTGALDSQTGVMILEALQQLSSEQKKTVIIVTHNAALADAADKVIKVRNGKIEDITINEHPISIKEVSW